MVCSSTGKMDPCIGFEPGEWNDDYGIVRFGWRIVAKRDMVEYGVMSGERGGFVEHRKGIGLDRSWIEPGSAVLDKARVGDGVHIGQGVVLKDCATIRSAEKPRAFKRERISNISNAILAGNICVFGTNIMIGTPKNEKNQIVLTEGFVGDGAAIRENDDVRTFWIDDPESPSGFCETTVYRRNGPAGVTVGFYDDKLRREHAPFGCTFDIRSLTNVAKCMKIENVYGAIWNHDGTNIWIWDDFMIRKRRDPCFMDGLIRSTLIPASELSILVPSEQVLFWETENGGKKCCIALDVPDENIPFPFVKRYSVHFDITFDSNATVRFEPDDRENERLKTKYELLTPQIFAAHLPRGPEEKVSRHKASRLALDGVETFGIELLTWETLETLMGSCMDILYPAYRPDDENELMEKHTEILL